jgi:hypothetical protein
MVAFPTETGGKKDKNHRRSSKKEKFSEAINYSECRFRVAPVEMPIIQLLW